MPRKSNSILTSKKADKMPLQIRIPADLKTDLDDLQERLKRVAPDLSFDTNDILSDALDSAVKAANREMDKLEKANRGNSPPGLQQPATVQG